MEPLLDADAFRLSLWQQVSVKSINKIFLQCRVIQLYLELNGLTPEDKRVLIVVAVPAFPRICSLDIDATHLVSQIAALPDYLPLPRLWNIQLVPYLSLHNELLVKKRITYFNLKVVLLLLIKNVVEHVQLLVVFWFQCFFLFFEWTG